MKDEPKQMLVVVNGEPRRVAAGTVAELIVELDLSEVRVAVMVDDAIVRRPERARVPIAEGSRIEIISMVGGG